ncbi:MAG TPA: endonuclease/exonuclease/phosphatase family protein [Nocardioidaceae bacterium]|nr:endonuclease/exonuclease/phosphatase family protein [Nocardioidaceae bacterium]
MSRLRVLTYNIWMGGRGGGLLDQAVRAAAPDVLLVNESPKTPVLWRRRCRRLGQEWGLRYVAGGRDAGSNMILVAPAIGMKSTYVTTLRQPFLQPRRGIAAAQLRVQGMLVGVVSCHLSLDQQRRAEEVTRVIEVADRLRGTVIVGGDLNERPGGPSWRALRAAGYVDHGSDAWPTFPAEDPTKRIDALLVRDAGSVVHHGDPGIDRVLQERASDHLAVLAVLDLSEPPPGRGTPDRHSGTRPPGG